MHRVQPSGRLGGNGCGCAFAHFTKNTTLVTRHVGVAITIHRFHVYCVYHCGEIFKTVQFNLSCLYLSVLISQGK